MKKKLSIALGFAISAICIYYAMRTIDGNALKSAIAKIHIWQLALIGSIIFVEFVLRALRWQIILKPANKDITLKDSFKVLCIGFGLNNILPLRLGELARGVIGSEKLNVPLPTVLATIVIERILDMMTIAVIFLLSAPYMPGLEFVSKYKPVVWTMLAAVIVAVAGLVFLDEVLLHSPTAGKILDKFPRIGKLVKQAAMGAEALRHPLYAPLILLSGALLWCMDISGYWLTAHFLSVEPAVTVIKAITLFCAAVLAVAAPQMPGYFGAFELTLQKFLVAWGTDPSSAFAFALLQHLIGFTLVLALGLLFLYQSGSSLGAMWTRLTQKGGDDEKKVS